MIVPGWTPFIDPLPVHTWWWVLLVPLSFGIAVVYKAVRVQTFESYWRQVLELTLLIVLGMVGAAIATYLIVEVFVPAIPAP